MPLTSRGAGSSCGTRAGRRSSTGPSAATSGGRDRPERSPHRGRHRRRPRGRGEPAAGLRAEGHHAEPTRIGGERGVRCHRDGHRQRRRRRPGAAEPNERHAGARLSRCAGHRARLQPGRDRLASASFDKTARVWDVSGREPAAVLRGQQGPVYAVAFAGNGDRVVSGGDGGLRVWDWRRGATLLSLPGGAFQVDAHGPGPRILRVERGAASGVVSVVDCDVCGSAAEVRALVAQRPPGTSPIRSAPTSWAAASAAPPCSPGRPGPP